jgi:hypothetical protein
MAPDDPKQQDTRKSERIYDVKGGVNMTDVSVVNKDGTASTVKVKFEDTASDKHTSDNKVVSGLKATFEGAVQEAAKKVELREITISATTNGAHGPGSLHFDGKALDISAINGRTVRSIGDADPVKSIQSGFQSQTGKRENMGPSMMKSRGDQDVKTQKVIDQHKDHIHLGVDK